MAKRVDPRITVGKRFQVDGPGGHKGWIRYVGPLHHEAEENGADDSKQKPRFWIGVEWDEDGRGKHDGTVAGYTYFTCPPSRGALIHPKRVCVGLSVVEGIKVKYASTLDDADESERYLVAERATGSTFHVKVELVGQDEIVKEQSAIDRLTRVVVHDAQVAHAGAEGELRKSCPRVQELDLENNLLASWSEAFQLGRELDLTELRLNSNALTPLPLHATSPSEPKLLLPSLCQLSEPAVRAFSSLQRLFLNNVPDAWRHVYHMAAQGCFPQLQELHLCKNRMVSMAISAAEEAEHKMSLAQVFPQLMLLNVSSNEIVEWSELARFGQLPQLRRLIANGNKIQRVWHPEKAEFAFAKLEWLSLNDNDVTEWSSIDEMNRFPSLKELRFQRNPVERDNGAGLTRALVIARVGKLEVLNHSKVGSRERNDAEKLYIRSCMEAETSKNNEQNESKANNNHPRLSELLEIHGKPEIANSTDAAGSVLSKRLVELTLYKCAPEALDAKASTGSENKVDEDAAAAEADTTKKKKKKDKEIKTAVKKVPPTMTIAAFKLVVQKLFKTPPAKQKLLFRNEEHDVPQELDDDRKQLSFYGVGLKPQGQLFVTKVAS